MKIAIGSDHRGFEVKRKIVPLLRQGRAEDTLQCSESYR